MKRCLAFFLLCSLLLAMLPAAEAAVKKKKVRRSRRHLRRIVRNWPKGGPRPVFPQAADEKATAVNPPAPAQVSSPVPVKPAPIPPKDYFFAEGGLAGGGAAAAIGYGRRVNEKFSLSGALGLIVFSQDNGVLLDLVRVAYDFNNSMYAGVGLSYARSLSGLELFAGKQFNRWSVRAGYSGAVGLRAAAGYEF